jgi:hypothetical protein
MLSSMRACSRSSALGLEKEQADLAKAEQDISDGQMRITEQELRIEELRARGRDTALSECLLENLKGTLEEWRKRRQEILNTIYLLQAS